MKTKTLYVPLDCEGALQAALRIRIIYLQSYRQQCEQKKYLEAAEAIMADIANLTMLSDKLAESEAK